MKNHELSTHLVCYFSLFKMVHDGRSLRGRSNDAIASACLYIACRQEGKKKLFFSFVHNLQNFFPTQVSHVPSKRLWQSQLSAKKKLVDASSWFWKLMTPMLISFKRVTLWTDFVATWVSVVTFKKLPLPSPRDQLIWTW